MKYKKIIGFILMVLIALMQFSGCKQEIRIFCDSIQLKDIKNSYSSIFDQLMIDSNKSYIVDINMEGFTIWISRLDGTVMETMLEMIYEKVENIKAEVIDIEYIDSAFYQLQRGDYDLNSDWKRLYDRVSMNSYLNFLSSVDYLSIVGEYAKTDTDYYEIRTDGLYRKIDINDYVLNYTCYSYEDSTLTKLDERYKADIIDNNDYLPVFFSIGSIKDETDDRTCFL